MTDLRRVFDDLIRFETVLWAALDERLHEEAGVRLGTLNVMLVIDATPECRVLDIAEALAITVGGTSQAVDRLAKAGHCARKPHPSDRRSSVVELTASGKELLSRAGPVFDRGLAELLGEPLEGSQLDRFATSLTTLRRSARSTGTTR